MLWALQRTNINWVMFSPSNVGKGIFFFLQTRTQETKSKRRETGRKQLPLPPPRKHTEGENQLKNAEDIKQRTQPEPFQFLILARQAPYTSLNGLISVIWVYILCLSNFLVRLSCCSANGYRLGVIGKTWLGLEWYRGKILKSNLCLCKHPENGKLHQHPSLQRCMAGYSAWKGSSVRFKKDLAPLVYYWIFTCIRKKMFTHDIH